MLVQVQWHVALGLGLVDDLLMDLQSLDELVRLEEVVDDLHVVVVCLASLDQLIAVLQESFLDEARVVGQLLCAAFLHESENFDEEVENVALLFRGTVKQLFGVFPHIGLHFLLIFGFVLLLSLGSSEVLLRLGN